MEISHLSILSVFSDSSGLLGKAVELAKTFTTMAIFAGLLYLFRRKGKNASPQNTKRFEDVQLEEITSRTNLEEGFCDIFLNITSEFKTDSSRIYICKGLHKGKTVGLQIEVSTTIGAGIVSGEITGGAGFEAAAIRLGSIGQESDEFVKALAALYKEPTNKPFTKQAITATAFSLNEKPVNLDENDYYQLKLFFEEDDEELYSEVYLNINTGKGEIEIHEKDEGYREPIITVLTR